MSKDFSDSKAMSAEHASVADFSLQALPDSFYDDPYPTYRTLQRHDPVHRTPDGSVFLTRHADLEAIYKDTTRFSSDKKIEFAPKYGVGSRLFEHHTTSLVFNDPPLHTRVRQLIAGALNPRAIAETEPGLVTLVDRLLDDMERSGVDLIEDFASAIPIEVIGNLLAVPHADRGPLRGWSLAILGALEPVLSDETRARGEAAVAEFLDYLRRLVAERRAQPGDVEHDVLTRLIVGETAGGERLSETELLQNCIFILNAGHETTTNLIGNGLELLVRFPEQRKRLIAEPLLIKTAVEEFLRFESSNQLGNRGVAVDTQIGGVLLKKGTFVTLCIGAANRDPAQFERPDELDITRSPNRHLAFASGAHVCAGLNLARMEGRVAIGRFIARFPDFASSGPARRARRVRFRGFTSFPVRLN